MAMLYIDDIGIPFFDPLNEKRIWTLIYNTGPGHYGGLQYSDNYGESWTFWEATPPNANYSTLYMDSLGNFYFCQSTRLYKMDRITKVITEEILLEATYNPHSWFSWAWGEDSDGVLYTAAYTLVGTGGQFMYKNTGAGWVRVDILSALTTQRHIHSLHVNPFNDKVYFSWGDALGGRGTGVSDDKLVTYTQIAEVDTPGPTGLTFTNEAVYISTDEVGGSAVNKLKSITDDLNAVDRWTVPQPYRIAPAYYCRAVSANEMWVSVYNETADANTRTAIFKLTKESGVASPWVEKKIIVGDDKARNGYDYYQIACGLNGVIPNTSPYVFIERIGRRGLYRFNRA